MGRPKKIKEPVDEIKEEKKLEEKPVEEIKEEKKAEAVETSPVVEEKPEPGPEVNPEPKPVVEAPKVVTMEKPKVYTREYTAKQDIINHFGKDYKAGDKIVLDEEWGDKFLEISAVEK